MIPSDVSVVNRRAQWWSKTFNCKSRALEMLLGCRSGANPLRRRVPHPGPLLFADRMGAKKWGAARGSRPA